jgi:hypothetical protein
MHVLFLSDQSTGQDTAYLPRTMSSPTSFFHPSLWLNNSTLTSLAHALIGLLGANCTACGASIERTDHTSLPLDASHMSGLEGPSHELVEPKRFSHWKVH